jgi:hypothetical protein
LGPAHAIKSTVSHLLRPFNTEPGSLSTCSSPPRPLTSPLPPTPLTLRSSPLPPSSPPPPSSPVVTPVSIPVDLRKYHYDYTFTPRQSPNGTWHSTGQVRYPGPAPLQGPTDAKNDRTRMVFDGIHFKVPAGLVAPRWHPQDLGEGAQSDIEMGGDGDGDDEGNLSWEGIGGGDDVDGQDDQMKGSSVSGEVDGPSSSDPSGSDYESYREMKEEKRNRLKKRGKASSDTEEDDFEEDEELRDEVVDDFTPRRLTQKRQYGSKRRRVHVPLSPPRYSAKAKGKQRAVETKDPKEKSKQRATETKDPKGKGKQPAIETGSSRKDSNRIGEEDAWEDVEGVGEEREGGRGLSGEDMAKVRGRLSREAIEEIEEFGKKIHDKADAIALRLRKDRTTILQLAGLSLSPARQPNFFNQFKTWYRQTHPQESCTLYSYLTFFFVR